MTSTHVLYIPTIFLLGFLAGSLLGKGSAREGASADSSGISARTLLGAFTIFAIVFIGTHFFEMPGSSMAVKKALNGLEIFDKHPSYSADEVYSRINLFPDNGRQLYKQFTYTIDVLFPLTLFVFLFLLTRYASRKSANKGLAQIAFTLLPILWLCADLVENISIFRILDGIPERHDALAGALGHITMTKFSLLLLSILVPTVHIIVSKSRRRVAVNQ